MHMCKHIPTHMSMIISTHIAIHMSARMPVLISISRHMSMHIYRTGSNFGRTFRFDLEKIIFDLEKISVLRFVQGFCVASRATKCNKSFVVPHKGLTQISKCLIFSSQKVPAGLEPFL